jgi:hypothetical protein
MLGEEMPAAARREGRRGYSSQTGVPVSSILSSVSTGYSNL